jgi:hypothetical protein
MARDG